MVQGILSGVALAGGDGIPSRPTNKNTRPDGLKTLDPDGSKNTKTLPFLVVFLIFRPTPMFNELF